MIAETPESDLDKLVSLLKEYTAMLSEDCERQLDRRVRFRLFRRAGGIVLGIVVIVIGYYAHAQIPAPSLTQMLLFMMGFAIFFFSLFPSAVREKQKHAYHAGQVALTLRRLVSMASQYGEHATKRFSDKFELDLRLAEAESILRTYQEVFGHSYGSEQARTATSGRLRRENKPEESVQSSEVPKQH